MSNPSELVPRRNLESFGRSASPFIGRRQQLEFLERGLKEASAGHPHVVLIQGDAGVGKTRLLKEVRAAAQRHGLEVCYGRCYEDLALPYLPFVESLLVYLKQIPEEVTHTLGADAEVISRFLQRAGATFPAAGPARSTEADQDTLRLFLALSRATIKLSQSRPMLLILDDLHWADRSSLDLFSHLVFAVAEAAARESIPLLIAVAHRPLEPEERLARAVARFQQEDICQTLQLPGLKESEVDELIQDLGLRHPTHQLVTTVSEATHGNPLFIQEALHYLVHSGALEERAGYLMASVSPADLRLPDQITTAIAARTQKLSTNCHKVLTLGSFLGDEFSFEILSAVSGENEDELLELLEEGMRQRLLLSEGQVFQFAHPLVRHVFYSEPSAVRRQRIHWHIAQTLERSYADSRENHLLEIAHHLVSAGPAAETEKVLEYARRAGDQAFTMFAWGEAARYYETALAVAERTEDFSDQHRGELYYLAGYARYRDMDVGPCLDHYEKAIAAYRLSGDVRGVALALKEKVGAHFTLASVPYGTLIDVQPLEEVITALGDAEPGLRGRLWAKIAQAYWHARQPEKAEQIARRVLEIGQRIKDDPLCAEASVALALAQSQTMRMEEALESWRVGLESAQRVNDLWRQGWSLQRMPLTLTTLGQLDEAEAVSLQACQLAHETHDWGGYSIALATLAFVAVSRGEFAAAERQAQEAMTMVNRSHYPWGGVSALFGLACARFLRGAWVEAENAIDLLVQPGRLFSDVGPAFQAGTRVYRQLLRAYSGAVDDVRKQLTANPPRVAKEASADIDSLARLCALVEISDLAGVPTLAEQTYPALSLAAERGVVFSRGWLFLIPRILGVAATLNRWWDKAETHFRVAIETASQSEARPELGRTYLDYARMMIARNEGNICSHAMELGGQASHIFADLGMEPFAQRAAQIAGQFQPAKRTKATLITDRSVHKPQVPVGVTPAPQALPPLIILFTDMEGSTAIIQRLGDVKAQQITHTHNAILRGCLREYDGTELQHTGDGVMATFPSASSAIACAVAVQKTFARYNQEQPETPIRVRIGLNAGEPLREEGRIFGAAVNAAARICQYARPGEILVSEGVRELTAGKDFVFASRGRIALKGFKERRRLYTVRWEEEA